jgi:EAL domain-containing protein (putative c-di-GMP-specific phosphodiesterase class I)
VPPGRFIPVAEDSGFIVAIGDWVLSQAVRQAALWHEAGRPVPIAINVSALQFQQAQFVDRVASVLAVSALPPHLLELELTESILVRDADEALARLHALARLGVNLSIDDFGTGYSSLAYLKRFPIGKLKIDRSFVNGLPDDESDAGIVRAILQMARALDMQVIAEGVESEMQRAFLQAAGCDEFQGFLYSPAVDSPSFEQLLGRQPRALPPALPAPPPPALIRLVR